MTDLKIVCSYAQTVQLKSKNVQSFIGKYAVNNLAFYNNADLKI